MTHRAEGPTDGVFSLDHVLSHFVDRIDERTRRDLYTALVNREDSIVELLHLAGAQFGLFPQIVAEVLTQVGLGTPKNDIERQMIRHQFVELMEQIQRAQSGEGPMPTP